MSSLAPVPQDAKLLAGVTDDEFLNHTSYTIPQPGPEHARPGFDRMVRPAASWSRLYADTRGPAPTLPAPGRNRQGVRRSGEYMCFEEWQARWDTTTGEAWTFENGKPTPQRSERILRLMALRRA